MLNDQRNRSKPQPLLTLPTPHTGNGWAPVSACLIFLSFLSYHFLLPLPKCWDQRCRPPLSDLHGFLVASSALRYLDKFYLIENKQNISTTALVLFHYPHKILTETWIFSVTCRESGIMPTVGTPVFFAWDLKYCDCYSNLWTVKYSIHF